MKLEAVPLTLSEANAFVGALHRHHTPVRGDKFRLGCASGGRLVGVVQVGRPVSRMLDDGKTLEVVRLCTDGTRNVCSFLYSRAAKIAKELGYSRIVTYILESEDGASLRASGYKLDKVTTGGTWDRTNRPRRTTAPTCPKKRYVKTLKTEDNA